MNMYSIPSFRKITHTRDFTDIIQNGFRFTGILIRVSYRKTTGGDPRIGISVAKRYGSAVKRNRFKRLVRESFRMQQHSMPPVDMIVMPIITRKRPEFGTVKKDFNSFITSVRGESA